MPSSNEMKQRIEHLEARVNSYKKIREQDKEIRDNEKESFLTKLGEAEQRFKSLQELTIQRLEESKKREEALQTALTEAEEILAKVAYKNTSSTYSADARNYLIMRGWSKNS